MFMKNQYTPNITISQFRKLFNLKVLEFDKDIPIIRSTACALDGSEMALLCRFTGKDIALSIEVGCCRKCGYVGYIDKPTEEWISTFYAEVWDDAKKKKLTRRFRGENKSIAYQIRNLSG